MNQTPTTSSASPEFFSPVFDPARSARPPESGPDHPRVSHGKVGVLLLNLGTPDGTDYAPMRAYLKEFLSDRRVIEEPKWKWWPILNLIILTKRPTAKGKDYASIWNNEKNEGPLKTITREQAEGLAARLAAHPDIIVDFAMRYQNPSTESRLLWLQAQGCDRILLVPLYPQYAAATTATANDHAFRALMKMRWQPAIRTAPAYHDDPVYIEALADSVRNGLKNLDFSPEVLIATFHGMPVKYLHAGDPYHCQSIKTGRLLRQALGMTEENFKITFQSRFGNDVWLQPYTDETVEKLAKSGVKRLAMVAPGFSADCLETLEELDVENREIFTHNGGEKFAYIPALNADPGGIDVIEHLVRRELMGWVNGIAERTRGESETAIRAEAAELGQRNLLP